MTLAALIQLIGGFIGGGLVGTFLTVFFSNRRAKTELTLKILEEYLANYELHNHVSYLLDNFDKYKAAETDEQKREINEVINIGNWFEIYAVLYKKRLINRKLVKELDFDLHIKDFFCAVERCGGTFDPQRFWKNMTKMYGSYTKKEKK